jgi:hypothetical protein
MWFREIIDVYSDNHKKPVNTLKKQVPFHVETGGTYSDRYALRG